MSRSRWKPPFIDSTLRETLSSLPSRKSSEIQGKPKRRERISRKRATQIIPGRVGHRIQISNGLRFFSLNITDERVHHRLGEFAPTRKRPAPILSKGQKAKKGAK